MYITRKGYLPRVPSYSMVVHLLHRRERVRAEPQPAIVYPIFCEKYGEEHDLGQMIYP